MWWNVRSDKFQVLMTRLMILIKELKKQSIAVSYQIHMFFYVSDGLTNNLFVELSHLSFLSFSCMHSLLENVLMYSNPLRLADKQHLDCLFSCLCKNG